MIARKAFDRLHAVISLRRTLGPDQRGATIIEFAIAGPVLILLLLGIYDLGHTAYLQAMLSGAAQQAARDNTLEGADTTKADAFVESIVKNIAPGADVKGKRSSYYDFADIKRPESWQDKNANGKCDKSENYVDENGNGQWDSDIGSDGNGGGNDVVLYTVTVKYTPVFINPFISGSGAQRTLTTSVVKKNQPFERQDKYATKTRTCP